MKRFPILFVTLALFLSACGSNTGPVENSESSAGKPINTEAIVFDTSDRNSLYALRVNGFSDFKLHSYVDGIERASKIANGTDFIVLGAVFTINPKFAYISLRKSVNGSSQDSVALYNIENDTIEKEVSNLYSQEISGTVYNSLHLEGNKLQFVAQRNTGPDQELPMPDQFELNIECGNNLSCGTVKEMTAGNDIAFQSLLNEKLNSHQSSISSQTLSSQALAVQMYWPKGVSGHHYPGSSFHSGRDAYSLDINRGGGEADHGDPVRAAAQGKVIEVIRSTAINTYGNRVRIQHSNGSVTLYAHLYTIAPTEGALIAAKESVGTVGNTGLDLSQPNVASHLHFTLYDTAGNGTYIANSYYPIYARVGSTTATCQNITTDMRDGREYFPC
ncbi:M23 family metallopeptidase [Deinococcus sp. HMF7604]|uniref:M23 family metallopeptidase n=1 Tax=Deinococcus betulae TaxID=2873312 RepID=UPI001CCFF958|nr:M23 family metallopeptidase [Deinococcus betulae]MBZ9753621.1 M23 family metallopeptidase [Deinococcus betulae]